MREYPLSPLHHQQLAASGQPAGSAFHTRQLSFSFGERIDRDRLVAAWGDLTTAHPILRTRLDPAGPRWVESDDDITDWQALDWQTDAPTDLGAAWQELVTTDAAHPVTTGHRLTTIQLPSGDLHLLWSYDDLLIDESALEVLLVEWLLRYEGDTSDTAPDDPAPAFAALTEHDSEEKTWRSHFQNVPAIRPLILLPLPPESAPTARRTTVTHTFEREHGQTLTAAAKTMTVEPVDLVKAAWISLLGPALSSHEIILLESIRLPLTAIARAEARVPRRHRLAPDAKVSALAQAVAQTRAESTGIGTWTAEQIANVVSGGAASTRPAAAFRYRRGTLNDTLHARLPRWLGADAQFLSHDPAPFTLIYTASDRAEVALDFDPGLFSEAAARRFLERWVSLIGQLIADPDRPLADLSILLPDEPTLVAGPEAAPPFRSLVPQCLHDLFAETASDLGDAVALETDGGLVTFQTLDQQSNQVARALRKLDVSPKSTVAIEPGPSHLWPAVMLGIWKAGATIELSGGSEAAPKKQSKGKKSTISIGESQPNSPDGHALAKFWDQVSAEKPRPIPSELSATDPAIRTADGRKLTHEEAGRLSQASAAALLVAPGDRTLQSGAPSDLDPIVELFGVLLSGATAVLAAPGGWSTRTAFQEFADQHNVTLLSIPTPFWSQWTHYLAELSLPAPASVRRTVIHGGRVAPAALAAWHAAAPTATLLHSGIGFHGPSSEIDPGDAFEPASHPPAGSVARITWQGKPLPPGFAGQLEVGASEDTLLDSGREAFLDDTGTFYPRNELEATLRPGTPTSRLETIERAILAHAEIFDCVLAPGEADVWNVWIVPADSQRGEPMDFRDHLGKHVPDLEFAVACIPRLPLDSGGQLDSSALPKPTREAAPTRAADPEEPQKPRGEDEKLRSILSRALGGRAIQNDTSISDGSTKPHVAKHLHETCERTGYPIARLADFQRTFTVKSLLREWRARKTAGKWEPLTALRAAGSLPPLVCFHDFGGGSDLYRELTLQLDPEQPVYAVTARATIEPDAAHKDVLEMAIAYAEAIRGFDAEGPHSLVGFGFGGILAIETARLLLESGREVALIVTLATEPPKPVGGLATTFAKLLGRKKDPAPRPGDSRIATANRLAAAHHRVEPLDVKIHAFLPELDFPTLADVQKGWDAISDEVQIYQVPCAPADLLEEPAVTAIADALTKLAANEDLTDEE